MDTFDDRYELYGNFIDSYYECPWEDLSELREGCERDHVPVIRRQTEMFLDTLLATLEPAKILEIGTAIGYSAIYFARRCENAHVVTIEKDEYGAYAAKLNFEIFGVSDRVRLIQDDGETAMDRMIDEGDGDFDLIFIDASKSHYRGFMDRAVELARPGAVILSDDILQHGFTVSEKFDPKGKHRTSMRRMLEYLDFITHCDYLKTSILNVGDGLAVSVYRGSTGRAGSED
ncbi:MAG: O-methyltransferase [Eubacterium sp.]|jgi:predicted O-methyltransferase YrrM